jgi:hypothetical protein
MGFHAGLIIDLNYQIISSFLYHTRGVRVKRMYGNASIWNPAFGIFFGPSFLKEGTVF